jgi:hypothetical protein
MHQLVDVCGIPDRLASLIMKRHSICPTRFPAQTEHCSERPA